MQPIRQHGQLCQQARRPAALALPGGRCQTSPAACACFLTQLTVAIVNRISMATAVTPTASLRTALAAQRAQTLHIKPFACIAAPARQAARFKRCKRGSLQVVAVRVENEEVALGTVAPDFKVKLASTGNVPWCSDDCTDCYSCCPFTDAPVFLCTSSAPVTCRCSSPSALRRPQLPDVVSGQTIKLSEYAAGAPATLVMFLCVHWCAVAAAVPCWCLPCSSSGCHLGPQCKCGRAHAAAGLLVPHAVSRRVRLHVRACLPDASAASPLSPAPRAGPQPICGAPEAEHC